MLLLLSSLPKQAPIQGATQGCMYLAIEKTHIEQVHK